MYASLWRTCLVNCANCKMLYKQALIQWLNARAIPHRASFRNGMSDRETRTTEKYLCYVFEGPTSLPFLVLQTNEQTHDTGGHMRIKNTATFKRREKLETIFTFWSFHDLFVGNRRLVFCRPIVRKAVMCKCPCKWPTMEPLWFCGIIPKYWRHFEDLFTTWHR